MATLQEKVKYQFWMIKYSIALDNDGTTTSVEYLCMYLSILSYKIKSTENTIKYCVLDLVSKSKNVSLNSLKVYFDPTISFRRRYRNKYHICRRLFSLGLTDIFLLADKSQTIFVGLT